MYDSFNREGHKATVNASCSTNVIFYLHCIEMKNNVILSFEFMEYVENLVEPGNVVSQTHFCLLKSQKNVGLVQKTIMALKKSNSAPKIKNKE